MQFKDEKEAAQQNVTLFFQVLFAESKTHIALYNVNARLQYDVTGLELTAWLETLSWLAVTNFG